MISKHHRRAALVIGALFALLALPLAASAQVSYPTKPISWIVAYPAGGGSDFLARTVASRLSRQLGQSIVIDNRPGAGTIIGASAAAKAAPDGYTIFTADNGSLVFNPALYSKLAYKPEDFAPIGLMARFPLLLVSHPSKGYASAKAMKDAATADSKSVFYASPGAGSPHHLAMELFKSRAGFDAQHVAYKGAAPAVQDVLGGQVGVMMLDTATARAHLQAGSLKPLAVAAAKRLPQYPDVPTFKELGYDVEVYAWQGLVVPVGTPPDIRDKLMQELQKTMADSEVIKALTDFGLELAPSDAKQMSAFTESEKSIWHPLIRARGIKLDN